MEYRKRLFLDILNTIDSGITIEDDLFEKIISDYEMYKMFKDYNIYSLIQKHVLYLQNNEYVSRTERWITLTEKGTEYIKSLKMQLALKELILAK